MPDLSPVLLPPLKDLVSCRLGSSPRKTRGCGNNHKLSLNHD